MLIENTNWLWEQSQQHPSPQEVKTLNARLADFDPIIKKNSMIYGIPTDVVRAIIAVESSCKPEAVSASDARGLMQVMRKTWNGAIEWSESQKAYPSLAHYQNQFETACYDPAANIAVGCAAFAEKMAAFSKFPQYVFELAILAYNLGQGTVLRAGELAHTMMPAQIANVRILEKAVDEKFPNFSTTDVKRKAREGAAYHFKIENYRKALGSSSVETFEVPTISENGNPASSPSLLDKGYGIQLQSLHFATTSQREWGQMNQVAAQVGGKVYEQGYGGRTIYWVGIWPDQGLTYQYRSLIQEVYQGAFLISIAKKRRV